MDGHTLTQIGEELLLSHPSVSKIIRGAELKAGVSLVEQRGRRLQLTADGTRVALSALEVLRKLHEMERLVAEVRDGESGVLRILATSTFCEYVLPAVVGDLLSEVCDIDLQIQAAPSGSDIWALFDRGDHEAAIARNPPPLHIQATHLYDDQLCLCVAAGSDLVGSEPADWSRMSGCTLIGPIGNDQMWAQFSLLGIRPGSRVHVPDVGLAKRLVEDGHAIALLYRSVALPEAAAGRIVMLPLPDAPMSVSYWMATRSGTASSQLTERFARLLIKRTMHMEVAIQNAPIESEAGLARRHDNLKRKKFASPAASNDNAVLSIPAKDT